MKRFQELVVWQKAHVLTLAVYGATRSFPKDELFALTSQMRRAATSIPSNIAEGQGRGGDREFHRFCGIAMGSACELEYQLLLSRDLHYLTAEQWATLTGQLAEVQKMLRAFLVRLAASS